MNKQQILATPSMPPAAPSYPRGPYRFVNREHMVLIFESDPNAIRYALPEPLEPDGSDHVQVEWIRMPDSSGFGDYTGCRVVIPCRFNQDACNFTAQMFLDNGAPIAAGREIWGYPMKRAQPTLKVVHDTLTGTLIYAGQNVASGTMAYKHESHACNHAEILAEFQRTQVNLKLIPHVDGTLAIVQLVGYKMVDVTVLGAWSGPGRLDLASHVNAPIADLPVKRIVGGQHFTVNLTLPYGRVLHDYRKAPKMAEA